MSAAAIVDLTRGEDAVATLNTCFLKKRKRVVRLPLQEDRAIPPLRRQNPSIVVIDDSLKLSNVPGLSQPPTPIELKDVLCQQPEASSKETAAIPATPSTKASEPALSGRLPSIVIDIEDEN